MFIARCTQNRMYDPNRGRRGFRWGCFSTNVPSLCDGRIWRVSNVSYNYCFDGKFSITINLNSMLYRYIIISFCLCVLSTFISTSIVRPGSSVFAVAFIFQVAAYFLMVCIAFVVSKVFKWSDTIALILSFLLSYFGQLLVLWNINGNDFFISMVGFHEGRDFVGFLLPFILSNIVLILWSSIKGKK